MSAGGTLIACTTQGNVVAFRVAEPSNLRPLPVPPTCLSTLPQNTPLRIQQAADASPGQQAPPGGPHHPPQANSRANPRARRQDSQDPPQGGLYHPTQHPVLAPGAAFRGSRGFEASQRGSAGLQPTTMPFHMAQVPGLQPDKQMPRQFGMQGRLAAMAQHTQHRAPLDQQQQQQPQQPRHPPHQHHHQQQDTYKHGPGNVNPMANGRRGGRGLQPRRGNEVGAREAQVGSESASMFARAALTCRAAVWLYVCELQLPAATNSRRSGSCLEP